MEKIKIFVVDDNLAARAMLSNIISTQEDMEVVGEGVSGEDSMPNIAEVRPDLILLEFEVSHAIKLNGIMEQIRDISPDIQVVICAAPNADELVAATTESGARDFVKKPYDRTKLFRTIRSAVFK